MELIAILRHSVLNGRRGLNAVARVGRSGLVGRGADADVGVAPQGGAVLARIGVPFVKLVEGDVVVRCNGGTAVSVLDEVEVIAVVNHVIPHRRRGRDAISRLFSCGGGRSRAADDVYTDVYISPETGAACTANIVPLGKVAQGNVVLGDDSSTALAFLDEVELGAVVHHARLGGRRSCDAVVRRSGRSRGRVGRVRSDDTNAHVNFSPKGAAVIPDVVPLRELLQGNIILIEDILTAGTGFDIVKFITVVNDTSLKGTRSLHAVSRGSGGGGGRRGSRNVLNCRGWSG